MKHLVEIDNELLDRAMATLHTPTIKATVEQALKLAVDDKAARQLGAVRGLAEMFADMPDFDRSEAW